MDEYISGSESPEDRRAFQKVKDFIAGKCLVKKKVGAFPALEVINIVGLIECLKYWLQEPTLVIKSIAMDTVDDHVELKLDVWIFKSDD
jgi:hypothetical protein